MSSDCSGLIITFLFILSYNDCIQQHEGKNVLEFWNIALFSRGEDRQVRCFVSSPIRDHSWLLEEHCVSLILDIAFFSVWRRVISALESRITVSS